ncbi:16S rRNA (uracil(1498)-N(3))-methyltransferase [Crocinitomicaceae bacterium]|mgnify:FL=1|nr:16S rRNA (uracil(1498)-N(3))-methyltransferase [Crocinitomicaceae bacterium]
MIFYAPQCTMNTKDYTLSEIESKHCIKVLRKQLGNHIELINGKGGHFSCEIIDPHFKRCKVKIEAKSEYPKSRYDIHIAMAVPKSSERLEWFLEKATELGIQTLSLINCGNSERTKINQKRLEKIAISALKQSKRYHLPIINAPIPFKKFIESFPTGFIGHCYDSEKKHAKEIEKILPFLIGPEGDFTQEEVTIALESGYTSIELSKNRLRTETAALTSVFYLSNV